MELSEISNEEYAKLVQKPFTRFQHASFYVLNARKVKEVKYFLFHDEKKRFAFVGGIQDGVLKCPFSSSFECLSEITPNNKIVHYHEAVALLSETAYAAGIKKIGIALPPVYYAPAHIVKFENALFANGFCVKTVDVNYEYHTRDFSDEYDKNIAYNARKSLNKSLKNGLVFEKTEDVSAVYNVIRQNRMSKGYSLWMSQQDVENTAKIIPTELFLITDENKRPIASALCHRIMDDIIRVVYWGNVAETDKLCPMNFLSFNVFRHYAQKDTVRIIDIGPSTQNSVPNYGLCDFKESIGCQCSVKVTYEKEL